MRPCESQVWRTCDACATHLRGCGTCNTFKTRDTFKIRAPVWDTRRTPVDKAINQLNQLKKADENIIESRRKGLLSQSSNQNFCGGAYVPP